MRLPQTGKGTLCNDAHKNEDVYIEAWGGGWQPVTSLPSTRTPPINPDHPPSQLPNSLSPHPYPPPPPYPTHPSPALPGLDGLPDARRVLLPKQPGLPTLGLQVRVAPVRERGCSVGMWGVRVCVWMWVWWSLCAVAMVGGMVTVCCGDGWWHVHTGPAAESTVKQMHAVHSCMLFGRSGSHEK